MTTGTLPDDIIIDGRIFPDLKSYATADINAQMDNHAVNTVGRTTFYAQWALANAGYYTGPINGKYEAAHPTALYDAFVALWGANYDDGLGTYPAPASGHITKKFFAAVMNDYTSLDQTIYKVTS